VAPSLLHAVGVTKASAQFPFATLWGSEGVEGKYPDLAWKIIAGGAGWPYREVLEPFALRGMPSVNEIVFYHRPSKTLIVTDLCFNMVGVKGLAARLVLQAFGTYNRLGVSRLFVSLIKDRRAFKESVQDILSLEFNRIVVSHGAIVEGDARSKLKACLDERELGI
jgi:hypothetical protein